MFLVRRKIIPHSISSPMLGKPGTDVAWLIEECFVRLTLGLLRKGNKKLVCTTRGLYQTSYHSLGEGTKLLSLSGVGGPWGIIEVRETSSSLVVESLEWTVWLSNWCCTCALLLREIKQLPVSMLLLSSLHGIFDTCGKYALSN